MTRTLAGWLAISIYRFATTTRYPTRTVEHLCAWIIIVWSYSVLLPGDMLKGPAFNPMLSIMSEQSWGWCGLTIGLLRVAALIGNGHWRPSPGLRFIGAAWGTLFWISLGYCYYLAVGNGAQDFPMRRALYVLVIGEFYSCYRCGHDIGHKEIGNHRGSVDAEYG